VRYPIGALALVIALLLALPAAASAADPFGPEPGSPIFLTSFPEAVASADINGDGAPDLIVASRDGSVVTEVNNGKGGFGLGPGSPIANVPGPLQIVTGEFTSSHNSDLAITSYDNNTVTILLGDGQGDFAEAQGSPVSVPAQITDGSMAVGKFITGKPDEIAVSAGGTTELIGQTGSGSFGVVGTPNTQLGPDGGPIVAGQFSSASTLDLAALDSRTTQISILDGNGSGAFARAAGSPFASGLDAGCSSTGCEEYGESLATGTFSSGTTGDLASGGEGGHLAVLLRSGSKFTVAPGSPLQAADAQVSQIVTGDFGGTSGVDGLATANYSQGGCEEPCTLPADSVSVLQPAGNGSYKQATGSPYDDWGITLSVAEGDFIPLNGLDDIAFADSNSCYGSGDTAGQNVAILEQSKTGITPLADDFPADDCPIPRATVTTGSPSSTSLTGATLTGTVDPNFQAITDCHFSYGTGSSGPMPDSAPCVRGAEGSGNLGASASVSGLKGLSPYHYELFASTAGGQSAGGVQTFTTCQAPSVTLGTGDTVAGCFVAGKPDPHHDPTWSSTGPVKINGLTFTPGSGGVTIDPEADTLHANGPGTFKVGPWGPFPYPRDLTVNFANSFSIGGSHTFTFGGVQVSGTIQFALLPGAEIQLTAAASMNIAGSAVQASADVTLDGSGIVGFEVGVGPAGDSPLDPNTLLFCDPHDKKQPEGFSCRENKLKDGKGSEWVLTPVGEYPTGNDQFLNPSCTPGDPLPIGWACKEIMEKGEGTGLFVLVAQNPAVVKIGPLGLEGLDIGYDSDGGTWNGAATLELGTVLPGSGILSQASYSSMVSVNATISTKPHFQFDQAGFSVSHIGIGEADLDEASFELKLHPNFEIEGDASFSAGPDGTFSISGGLEFAVENGGWDLKIRGSYGMETVTVGGDIEVDTEDNSFKIILGGSFTRNWGPLSATVDISGGIQFDPFRWQVIANGNATAFGQSIGATGVVSNAGIGLCGEVHVLVFSGDIGFKHFWNGGFDWDGCDFSGLYTVSNPNDASDAAVGGHTVRVAPGTAHQEFAAVGADGPPDVVLSGPGGQTWTTPPTEDKLAFTRNGAVVAVSSSHTTYFDIDHPPAGTWTIAPAAGQPAPERYELASPLAPVDIHARVTGTGARRRLSWKLHAQRGQTVQFMQEGGTTRTVATTSRDRGRAGFVIAPGPGGKRTIVALISIDGFPRSEQTVARFRAPAPTGPRVIGARYRLKRGKLLVQWHRARSVASYEVDIHLRHGVLSYMYRPRADSASAVLVDGQRVKHITVTATGTNEVRGRPAVAKPVVRKRRRHRHR
jgi:hypothetical protein